MTPWPSKIYFFREFIFSLSLAPSLALSVTLALSLSLTFSLMKLVRIQRLIDSMKYSSHVSFKVPDYFEFVFKCIVLLICIKMHIQSISLGELHSPSIVE